MPEGVRCGEGGGRGAEWDVARGMSVVIRSVEWRAVEWSKKRDWVRRNCNWDRHWSVKRPGWKPKRRER